MKKMMQKGFTMVELLIVIALLGALAIGLIGALDPLEQLKKGSDTATRETVSEVQSAIIRYYALKGYMPWCTSATSCASVPSGTALASGVMVSAISAVIGSGEMKSNFTTVKSGELTKIFVTGDTDNSTTCYAPASKAFKNDGNTVFTISGTTGTTYWCLR